MIGFYIQHKNDFSDRARYVFRQLAKMIGVQMVEVNEFGSSTTNLDLLIMYGDLLPIADESLPVIYIAQGDYSSSAALNHFDVKTMHTQDSDLPESIHYLFDATMPHLATPLYSDAKTSEVMISREKN